MTIKKEIDYSIPTPSAGTTIVSISDLDQFFTDRDNKQYLETIDGNSTIKWINLSGLYCYVTEEFVRNFFLGHYHTRQNCKYTYTFETVPSLAGVYKVTAVYKGK